MTDIVDAKTRSWMMSNIRGKNTRPEMTLRRAMHARGYRYRLHGSTLPGKPDLVFPKYQAVCFVHGCFWHRHSGCRFTTTPATRTAFWEAKFEQNKIRDSNNVEKLLKTNWRVAIIWECALRSKLAPQTIDHFITWLRGTVRGASDSVEIASSYDNQCLELQFSASGRSTELPSPIQK